jgi:hypothetical protein
MQVVQAVVVVHQAQVEVQVLQVKVMQVVQVILEWPITAAAAAGLVPLAGLHQVQMLAQVALEQVILIQVHLYFTPAAAEVVMSLLLLAVALLLLVVHQLAERVAWLPMEVTL